MDVVSKRGRPKGSRSKSEPPLHKLQQPRRKTSCAPVHIRNPTKERTTRRSQSEKVPAAAANQIHKKPRNYYLVENSMDKFSYSKLPKKVVVIRRILAFGERDIKNAVKQTVAEIRDVWKYHFGVGVIYGKFTEKQKGPEIESSKIIIPTAKIEKNVRGLYDNWKELARLSRRDDRRDSKNFKERELIFKQELEEPLNISKDNAREVLMMCGIKDWKTDFVHLQQQMTKTQIGSAIGIDMVQKGRDKTRDERMISAEKRRSKSLEVGKRVETGEQSGTTSESNGDSDIDCESVLVSRLLMYLIGGSSWYLF